MKDLIPWRKKSEEVVSSRRPDATLDLLERKMTHLFEDFFDDYGWDRGSLFRRGTNWAAEYPYFEVSETDEEYCVKAELPGMDEKDIEVTMEGHELTVRGERKRESEATHRDYYVSEVSYGEFCRSIDLPEGVDRDKVKATFRKGELLLTLPKTTEGKALRKRINVIAA
jgi:HSP20 family protein